MNEIESPDPNNAPRKILMHSGQWSTRRKLLNLFAKYNYATLGRGHLWPQEIYYNKS